MEAADDQPEELVTAPDAVPVLATERDLELLAEEQVLEEETLAAPEDVGEGGQEKCEEFDHRGRITDGDHPARTGAEFCRPTPSGDGRALIVGHPPTAEAAVLGLTGESVPPIAKGSGVEVVQEEGRYRVELVV